MRQNKFHIDWRRVRPPLCCNKIPESKKTRICSVNMLFFLCFSTNFPSHLFIAVHIQAGSHIKGQELFREKTASDVGIISAFHATRSIQIVALSLPLLVMTTDCAGLVPPLARRLGLMMAPVGGSISNILPRCRKSSQYEKPSLKCTLAWLE